MQGAIWALGEIPPSQISDQMEFEFVNLPGAVQCYKAAERLTSSSGAGGWQAHPSTCRRLSQGLLHLPEGHRRR